MFVRAINLVSNNRVTEMCQVDTDLVRSARARKGAHNGEPIFSSAATWPDKSSFHSELCPGRRAFCMDRLFQPNR